MSEVLPLADAVVRVDWDQPWLQPLASNGRAVRRLIATGADACRALNTGGAGFAGIRFIPALQQPAGMPYEICIDRHGSVPTRDNLHDLLNGLIWLRFPRIKRQLNQWHVQEIARADGTCPMRRGALRDALTVLDENGAFLQAPDALWQALAERAWKRLFIELRPLWKEARLTLFGHALLEKLVQPRKSMTAHVLRLPASLGTPDNVDELAATCLTPQRLLHRPVFMPLPVLGVPLWWSANEEGSFYDDAQVFRPTAASSVGAQAPLKTASARRHG